MQCLIISSITAGVKQLSVQPLPISENQVAKFSVDSYKKYELHSETSAI